MTEPIEATQGWHVLHTRSRQEKAVARTLSAAGVRHYLPLVPRVAFSGSRKRVVQEPLFPCYLFLHGPLDATYFATATGRVANVISVAEQDRFAGELEQIRRAVSSGADLLPDRYLSVGRRVRVRAGPLRGLEGLIDQHRRCGRLVLQVDVLGRAVSLEMDASLLEPVD